MNREELLKLLREHKSTLSRRFGITELALYGSFARDSAADHSDVDILVRFSTPPNWRQYFDAHAYLEETLGRPVDMAMHREIRAEIRPYVEREAVDV
ncbi:MAG: nucleotidyltransferase family protein [Caldilineaceae bacterium]|nr:nucleotidyltransferase family protein [Caldilineaceae bacterium]